MAGFIFWSANNKHRFLHKNMMHVFFNLVDETIAFIFYDFAEKKDFLFDFQFRSTLLEWECHEKGRR